MIQEIKCAKCGINGVNSTLTAIPMYYLCQKCLSKNIELEAENKELKGDSAVVKMTNNQLIRKLHELQAKLNGFEGGILEPLQEKYKYVGEENVKLEAENEKMIEALERIDTWAKAYPLDIFPKPDLKKAHKVLKTAGLNLDEISADAMRHVLGGIKNTVDQALKGE
jgi:hypothetical protein